MASIAALRSRLEREPVLADALCHEQVLPERAPLHAEALPAGFELLKPVLEQHGIEHLYVHQARALEGLARGHNVALATPTASGKTLVYNLPALRNALADPPGRALYLFPLKALARDQLQRLEADAAALGVPISAAIYDGDTPQSRRRKIREQPPDVLITTPDMLHAGILPHHVSWEKFFRGLSLVVIDELHAYRGVFGSHVAQVLRRLLRVARFHGQKPQLVAASATIGNAGELAAGLTGEPFQVVAEDGAPRTRRHLWMLNPDGSPYTAAARLFRTSVNCGLRTLAFTKARRVTELMHAWILEAEPALRDRISSYRAGFLPSERREIERRLFAGELLGVISTSALEMGIDVGALDVCILVGYPGSQVSLWQRGGRVGREREAAIALVAQPDALDQYLAHHPELLVDGAYEHAVVDPGNPELLAAHLPCAASEIPLRGDEAWLGDARVSDSVGRLEAEGALLRSETGREWFAARRRPHREVSLRNVGSAFTIQDDRDPDADRPVAIGSIGGGMVFSECHEGAIYLHRGRQFLVTRLDATEQTVSVRPVKVDYYTRALSEKETEILSRDRARPAGNFRLVEGRVKVTTFIRGFERRRVHGQDLLGTEKLDLPPSSFETTGVWIEIPDEIPAALKAEKRHVMGGIHAVEHAALALFPLFALCDRLDVAGISHTKHPQLKKAAIFLYDGAPGGLGLVASLFDRFESLLETTLERIGDCACEEGCPACIHSPRCGSGNRPLDKQSAIRTLGLLLGHEPLPALETLELAEAAEPLPAEPEAAPEPDEAPPLRLVFFDLETQRSAQEVGGWHNAHLMRVALAVTFDTREGSYRTWYEADVAELIAHLKTADLVIGFNIVRFDYRVLRGYTDDDLTRLASFDMLDAIHARLGYRLPLAHLAEETLGIGKSGDGLQSIAWWREGQRERVADYCRRDVEILCQLFDHAVRDGHLIFRTKTGERVRLPARWDVAELVETARAAGPDRDTRRAG